MTHLLGSGNHSANRVTVAQVDPANVVREFSESNNAATAP